jgi:hypothetical protein
MLNKITALCFWATLISPLAYSQGAYNKGDKFINIGIGANTPYRGGVPLSISYEQGIDKDISVGGSIDFLQYNYNPFGNRSSSFTTIYFAGRASFHFNKLLELQTNKADVYAGLMAGFRTFSWKDNYYNNVGGAYTSGLFLGAFIGGRYFFNPKVGAFVELGAVGSTNAKLGVTFKF